MVKVRNAVEADVDQLVEMGRAFHKESPRYNRLTFSGEKVAALIRWAIASTMVCPAEGGILVAEKDGTIVGMMGGFVMQPWFSEDRIASDYGIYIAPEHRGSGKIALLLVRAFEAWAASKGVTELSPGVTADINAEQVIRFYEKLGYERYDYSTLVKRIG